MPLDGSGLEAECGHHLFQQRTGGITPKTIVDVHTGTQDRTTGLHEVNAAIFWSEVP